MANNNILTATDSTAGHGQNKWKMYALLAFFSYLILVQIFRFRRINGMTKKYAKYLDRKAMKKMTDDEAFEITQNLRRYEMPIIMEKSLAFALFRVSESVVYTSVS